MIDEILKSISDEIGIAPDTEYAKKFLSSIKDAVPVSKEVMEKDWLIYAEKLSKKLREEEGQETVELSYVYQSWSMEWMARYVALISGMLLLALSIDKGDGQR